MLDSGAAVEIVRSPPWDDPVTTEGYATTQLTRWGPEEGHRVEVERITADRVRLRGDVELKTQ